MSQRSLLPRQMIHFARARLEHSALVSECCSVLLLTALLVQAPGLARAVTTYYSILDGPGLVTTGGANKEPTPSREPIKMSFDRREPNRFSRLNHLILSSLVACCESSGLGPINPVLDGSFTGKAPLSFAAGLTL